MTATQQKAPPAGIQEWDFSYDARGSQLFRWRLPDYQETGDEWLCTRIGGKAWCRYANSKTHHLALVCSIVMDDDGAVTVFPPKGDLLEALKAEPVILNFARAPEEVEKLAPPEPGLRPLSQFPQGRHSHWRMCSLNWENAWRLRDERSTEPGGELYVVNGYRGLLNFNWMDGGSHVFADNEAHVDEFGIVHFG